MKNASDIQEVEIKSVDDLIETVADLSQEEYENIRQRALSEAVGRKHSWVQRGRGKLVCNSCPFPHTAYIDPELRLMGLDEQGNPIFDKL